MTRGFGVYGVFVLDEWEGVENEGMEGDEAVGYFLIFFYDLGGVRESVRGLLGFRRGLNSNLVGSPSCSVHRIFRILKSDRKSTRLNSSHALISYAVFCLKKKKKKEEQQQTKVLSK